MFDPRDHVDEALQELLDGRLAPAERAAVEAHLAGCPRCARLRLGLERTRAALRSGLAGEDEPSEPLRGRILAALDAEDRAQAEGSAAPPPVAGGPFRPLWPLAAAAALAVAALLWFALWPPAGKRTDAVRDVAAELGREGEPAVELAATAPAELERRFAASGLPFRPRVLDLGMMGFALAGGRIGRVEGEPSAVMVYRGEDRDDLLVCVMYRGRLAALPAADRVTRRGDFVFHLFRRGATTLVFWQEGELVCVLVSRGDPDALLELAAAKAMLAPGVRRGS